MQCTFTVNRRWWAIHRHRQCTRSDLPANGLWYVELHILDSLHASWVAADRPRRKQRTQRYVLHKQCLTGGGAEAEDVPALVSVTLAASCSTMPGLVAERAVSRAWGGIALERWPLTLPGRLVPVRAALFDCRFALTGLSGLRFLDSSIWACSRVHNQNVLSSLLSCSWLGKYLPRWVALPAAREVSGSWWTSDVSYPWFLRAPHPECRCVAFQVSQVRLSRAHRSFTIP